MLWWDNARRHQLPAIRTALCAVLIAGCSPDAPRSDTTQPTHEPVATNGVEVDAPENAPSAAPIPAPTPAPDSAETVRPGAQVRTENGAYLITFGPRENEIRIGKLQAWVASITNRNGVTFTPNALYFDGGMPGHGHGLPSAPRFTEHLGGSDYLLQGMKLNMPGDWRFVVTVGGPDGVDSAVFNMNLQPGPLDQAPPRPDQHANWSASQLALIESLRLDGLDTVRDQSNRFVGNADAISLGQALFQDPGLSAGGDVSCASCHQASHGFGDSVRFSTGSQPTQRHTPALLGTAQASWFYWDGRRDSLWAQALTPIETVGEMDNSRMEAVRYVANHSLYAKQFMALAPEDAAIFKEINDTTRFPVGASPFGNGKYQWHRMAQDDKTRINRLYATLGKIIASWETTLTHTSGRFDRWATQLQTTSTQKPLQTQDQKQTLTATERAGLALFLDLPKTQCLRCHNGPLFTNQGFHNVGTAESQTSQRTHDFGRMLGLQAVIVDPFNCSGEFSDAPEDGCDHLTFARRQNIDATIDGAFKVPSLRNLQSTAPYFHDGRFATLTEAVDHYRNQLDGDRSRVSEVPDIELTDEERDQLVAFLLTL